MSNRECFQKSVEVMCKKIDELTVEIANDLEELSNGKVENVQFMDNIVNNMYKLCEIKVSLYDSTMSELYNMQSLLTRTHVDDLNKEEADNIRTQIRAYSRKIVQEGGKLSDANDYLIEQMENIKLRYSQYNSACERNESFEHLYDLYLSFVSKWGDFEEYDDEVHAFFKGTLDPLKKEIYGYIDSHQEKQDEPGNNN